MNLLNPMNSIKKYLPWAVLGFSGLLLILSVMDIFAADLLLFDLLILHLAVFALLILSLGLTVFACVDRHTRRPLALLACLLQTPIGGGLLLLYVYEWAFPDHLPLGLILPFVVLLVSVASALQAGVLILCIRLYEEDDPQVHTTDDLDELYDESLYADLDVDEPMPVIEKTPSTPILQEEKLPEESVEEQASEPIEEPIEEKAPTQPSVTAVVSDREPAPAPKGVEKAPEAAKPAPVKEPETPKITPVKVPVRASAVEVTPEDEEELSPIPKKKNKYQPAFETVIHPAVPVVPTVPKPIDDLDEDMKIVEKPAEKKAPKAAAFKSQDKKKAYTDPFGLLTEEVKAEQSSVKSIFSDPDQNRE